MKRHDERESMHLLLLTGEKKFASIHIYVTKSSFELMICKQSFATFEAKAQSIPSAKQLTMSTPVLNCF